MPEQLTIAGRDVEEKPATSVSTSTAGFIGESVRGPVQPCLIESFAEYEHIYGVEQGRSADNGASHSYLATAVQGFFANGGRRCVVTRVEGKKGNPPTRHDYCGRKSGQKTGLAAMATDDEISKEIAIVCAPDEHRVKGLTEELVKHCEELRDRFAVLQAKQDTDPLAISALPDKSKSKYAAFYLPWIQVVDPATGITRSVPPGGHVAGIFARSDIQRGVHKAPANEVVHGAVGLERPVTREVQERLNNLGVNCIRNFGRRGIRLWGARTTSSDPPWNYVNVSRLFMFLEASIKERTRWVVAQKEPNDRRLWARVRQTVSDFLTNIWRDGALMGGTPGQAFEVHCGENTMTKNDIKKGRLVLVVGVAAVRPAEFIFLHFSDRRGAFEIVE